MNFLYLAVTLILFAVMVFGAGDVMAQNATNSTMPPNAIRTPGGGWITPLQTTDQNGKNLTIHYETGTRVSGSYANPGPPPDPIFVVDNRNQIDNFLTNHEILIHYDVNPVLSGSSPLDLEIKLANNGNLILDDKKHLVMNGTHSTVVFWRFVPTIPGNYTLEKYNNGIHTSTTSFTVSGSKETLAFPVLVSPLQQMHAEIPVSDTECTSNFKLMIKTSDGYPACVKPDTAAKLVERGWGTISPVLQTSSTLVPASFIDCHTPYPQAKDGIAVLYMPTNSVGKICVRYHDINKGTTSVGIRISEANNLMKDASEVTTWTSGNTIQGNTTIVYVIKTGDKAGLYSLSLVCSGMPFAVGYDNNSTLSSNDFPWVNQAFHCGAITFDYHIDSTEGIGVRYIPDTSNLP